MPVVMFSIFPPLCVSTDAPKILGPVVLYTWEGNAANISCEVDAHPGASVVWFRDGVQAPSANTTNMKIYNTPTISYLEVCCTSLTYKSTTGVNRTQIEVFLKMNNIGRACGLSHEKLTSSSPNQGLTCY